MMHRPSLPHIVLASGSPYRRELLSRLRLPFDVAVPNIDERPKLDEPPVETALRLAREKALAVAASHNDRLVIGSDQVAMLDGKQIGKPGTHANALGQLQAMRGRCVLFHTALCLIDTRNPDARSIQIENVTTSVTFRTLADSELDAYLHAEKPYDCAGSAKIEGLGITLIEKLDTSDPSALIGLPLITLTTMLRSAGVSVFQTPSP
jgi:septum formation protein